MPIRRYQDFDVWKLCVAFKAEVFELVLRRHRKPLDLRFRGDLIAAVRSITNNFAEGFLKCSPGEFVNYLAISIGSLGEVENHIRDGIDLGHFDESDCQKLYRLGRRAAVGLVRLKQSQQKKAKELREKRKKSR